MILNTRKERFSLAYIGAVAAHAGFQVSEPILDFDSVDGRLESDEGKRPRLEFQAKATADQNTLKKDHLSFPLPIKNYNDLRVETIVPRILIVVLLPLKTTNWLSHSEEELRLRCCGYWRSLYDLPDTDNETNVTVHIPRSQVFDSEQLAAIMNKVNDGETL